MDSMSPWEAGHSPRPPICHPPAAVEEEDETGASASCPGGDHSERPSSCISQSARCRWKTLRVPEPCNSQISQYHRYVVPLSSRRHRWADRHTKSPRLGTIAPHRSCTKRPRRMGGASRSPEGPPSKCSISIRHHPVGARRRHKASSAGREGPEDGPGLASTSPHDSSDGAPRRDPPGCHRCRATRHRRKASRHARTGTSGDSGGVAGCPATRSSSGTDRR